MNMVSQGFPLYGTTDEASAPGVWAVVGWAVVGNTGSARPVVAPLGGPVRNAIIPRDDYAWTLHATQAEAETAASPERAVSAYVAHVEQEEGAIRTQLALIAERLDVLGATAPARRIRELLDNPAEPVAGTVYGYSMSELAAKLEAGEKADDLRERLSRLADVLEQGNPGWAERIRQELGK